MPFIKHGASVLDIGCGNGTLLQFLLEKKEIQATGIDISETAVTRSREKGINAGVADITQYGPGKFDYIVMFEILEHIPDAEKAIQNVRESFNEKLFVSIPNAGYIWNRVRFLYGKFPVVSIIFHINEHVRFWTVSDFKEWCNALGFVVDRVLPVSGNTAKFGLVKIPLFKLLPALFAHQILYIVVRKGQKRELE